MHYIATGTEYTESNEENLMVTSKVTVCVPVFNEVNEISRFCECMSQQIFTDFTIKFLDDGSTDGSLNFLLNYDFKGLNIEILSQANMGLPHARNRLKESLATPFFTYIDIDDAVPPNYLVSLVEMAEKNPTTTVFCQHWYNIVDLGLKKVRYKGEISLTEDGVVEGLAEGRIAEASWGKLFPSSNSKNAFYPTDLKIGDDLCTVYRLMGESVFCDSTNYIYLMDGSGLASKYNGLDYVIGAKRRLANASNARVKKKLRAQMFLIYADLAKKYIESNRNSKYARVLVMKARKYLLLYLLSDIDTRSKLSGIARFLRLFAR